MDCDVAGYKQARYDEIGNEMKSTLIKVGWKKDFVEKNTPVMPISGWMGDNLLKKSDNMGWWKKEFIEKNTPVLPISGWMGDNLLKKSDNMGWWKGMDVEVGKETVHVETLYDVPCARAAHECPYADAHLGYLQDQGRRRRAGW